MPVTMTLYAVSTFEPTDKLLGPWYGVHSDGQLNPQLDRGPSGRDTASRRIS